VNNPSKATPLTLIINSGVLPQLSLHLIIMSNGLRYWQKTYIHPNIALQCLFQFMVLAIGTIGSVFWCGFWPSSHCTDGAEYPLFLLFTIAFPLGVVVLSIAESLTDLLNARSMFLYETVKTMLATATYAFAWHFQQFRETTEVVVASTIVLT
jgi:hypothetical protein